MRVTRTIPSTDISFPLVIVCYIHLFLILNYRENSNRTPCISFSSHPCDRGQSDFLTGISEALSSVSIQVTDDRSHLYFDYLELEFGIPKPLGYAIRKAILLHRDIQLKANLLFANIIEIS